MRKETAIDEIRKRHEAQTSWRDYDPPATMYQDRADLLDEIDRLWGQLHDCETSLKIFDEGRSSEYWERHAIQPSNE